MVFAAEMETLQRQNRRPEEQLKLCSNIEKTNRILFPFHELTTNKTAKMWKFY